MLVPIVTGRSLAHEEYDRCWQRSATLPHFLREYVNRSQRSYLDDVIASLAKPARKRRR